ncbi:MAG TPA: sigma-54 dependent transcriptional regulator [Nitrospira sp.]|nr:sigma-54 dependent transcriptional regulator [Nitrospira sp.]
MAGSQSAQISPFNDPILAARLEAIKQLAGGLSERVAVMDRDFNLIYANETAWAELQAKTPSGHESKCYEAFVHRTDPCETCPAIKVFHAPDVQRVSCSSEGDGTACGMQQAFPLTGSDGQVASMLVLFKVPTRSSRLPETLVPEETSPPMVREHLGDLIGRSATMQQLFDMISLVADSSATVLIQGESGTGKELVAKTIHQLSYRREKPFVVVDCGSLPETLLESELFGHVKGAFTGAVSNKRGLFEEADGGTIFLDEIADTTPTFQAKMLRVLQEGEIKRVGGNQPIKIDARVISATNKDLTELVKAKQFRQDLYYRLAVLPLYVPPLRDRKEDIPLLVERFIVESCRKHRQAARHVSGDALHALTEASWPGNVRELQHYIERAVVTTAGPELTCKDIVAMGSEPSALDLRSVSRSAMKKAERARIIQALEQSHGNRVKAAKHLKISRAGLYNKLREYNLA